MGLSVGPITLAVLCFVAYSLVSRTTRFRHACKAIRHHPGWRLLLTPTVGLIPKIVPFPIPYITASRFDLIKRKYEDFREAGSDMFSLVSFLPITTSFYLADPEAIRDVFTARYLFLKPAEMYEIIAFYGRNIVVSEGEEWKRYRKIAYPSFSERNNKLVWEETQRVVLDLFENEWGAQRTVCVDDVLKTTVAIALFVISSAGFGQRISWQDEGARLDGYEMSFKETMYEVSNGIIARAMLPKWLLQLDLTTRLRKTRVAFEHLEKYMLAMIQERRTAEVKEQRGDLLSGLTDASEEGTSGFSKLTDIEVISNIFIFLIAGHETTAHTLCFALALLALYPEEQEKLYEQTKSVSADHDIPSYDDISSYTYALAVFYETLRLFPPAGGIPKYAAEDTVLSVSNSEGTKVPVPVPKGSGIIIHVPGLHHNPKYWPEPDAFKPSRFLNPDWPRDAFLPFSGGARSCIGRRFSEVEVIAALTLLTLRYKIDVKEEPQFADETFQERKARLLSMDVLLTLTPLRVPLTFTRRD